MLNMIKMDLYRMFRTKSMYVVWIVLVVSVLFTTFMCKTDYDLLSKEEKKEFVKYINFDSTPVTVFLKNGEESTTANRIVGAREEEYIIGKLKSNGYIE